MLGATSTATTTAASSTDATDIQQRWYEMKLILKSKYH